MAIQSAGVAMSPPYAGGFPMRMSKIVHPPASLANRRLQISSSAASKWEPKKKCVPLCDDMESCFTAACCCFGTHMVVGDELQLMILQLGRQRRSCNFKHSWMAQSACMSAESRFFIENQALTVQVEGMCDDCRIGGRERQV